MTHTPPLSAKSCATPPTTPPAAKDSDKSCRVAVTTLATPSSAAACSTSASEFKALTVDALFGQDKIHPSGKIPSGFKYSPNGCHLVGIYSLSDDVSTLWEFHLDGTKKRLVNQKDLKGNDSKLSNAEILLRETQRIAGQGIHSFQWRPDSRALLFKLGTQVWEYNWDSGVRPLTGAGFKGMCVSYLPDSQGIAYVEEGKFCIADLDGKRLYQKAEDGVSWGAAEYAAAEELNRYDGYWFSPDQSLVALARVDERGCETVTLPQTRGGKFGHRSYPYHFVGTPSADVQLHVVNWRHPEEKWEIPLGNPQEIYLARVHWLGDGEQIAVQVLNRQQTSLSLKIFNVGSRKLVREFQQTDSRWVNVHDDIHFLQSKKGFLWKSWQDGHSHLYYYSLKGTKVYRLTKGDWEVTRLVHVDETNDRVYFLRTLPGDPTIQQLAHCSFSGDRDPSAPTAMTGRSYVHSAVIAPHNRSCIVTTSSEKTPPRVLIQALNDWEQTVPLTANPLDNTHPYWPYHRHHCEPEFGQIEASDGQALCYTFTTPPGFEDAKDPVPLLLSVYGGPCVQRVRKCWAPGMDQVLAQRGFAVLQVDNRGSTNRGHAFETRLKGQFGTVEVEDQVLAVKTMLKRYPQLDKEHVDVFGWSYGGFMALMLACRHPKLFRKAISGAPPTDWRLYDDAYTGRYLGDPKNNKAGYDASNPINYLEDLKKYLDKRDRFHSGITLCFGLDDPNVLAENSLLFIDAAQKLGIHVDQAVFPGGMHSVPRGNHYFHRMLLHILETPQT